jgi:hypothetical protein
VYLDSVYPQSVIADEQMGAAGDIYTRGFGIPDTLGVPLENGGSSRLYAGFGNGFTAVGLAGFSGTLSNANGVARNYRLQYGNMTNNWGLIRITNLQSDNPVMSISPQLQETASNHVYNTAMGADEQSKTKLQVEAPASGPINNGQAPPNDTLSFFGVMYTGFTSTAGDTAALIEDFNAGDPGGIVIDGPVSSVGEYWRVPFDNGTNVGQENFFQAIPTDVVSNVQFSTVAPGEYATYSSIPWEDSGDYILIRTQNSKKFAAVSRDDGTGHALLRKYGYNENTEAVTKGPFAKGPVFEDSGPNYFLLDVVAL